MLLPKEELKSFGVLRFHCRGEGRFAIGAESYNCILEIGQLIHGDVLIALRSQAFQLYPRGFSVDSISGVAENGMLVKTVGRVNVVNVNSDLKEDQAVAHVDSMEVTAGPGTPSTWRYGLTNFLQATPPDRFSVVG